MRQLPLHCLLLTLLLCPLAQATWTPTLTLWAEPSQTANDLFHWRVEDQGWLILEHQGQQLLVKGPSRLRIEAGALRLLHGNYDIKSQQPLRVQLVQAELYLAANSRVRLQIDEQGQHLLQLQAGQAELIWGPRQSLYRLWQGQALSFAPLFSPHPVNQSLQALAPPQPTPEPAAGDQTRTLPAVETPVTPVAKPVETDVAAAQSPEQTMSHHPLASAEDRIEPLLDRPRMTLDLGAGAILSNNLNQGSRLRQVNLDGNDIRVPPFYQQQPGSRLDLSLELIAWHWFSEQQAWQWRFQQNHQPSLPDAYPQLGQGAGLALGQYFNDGFQQHQYWLAARLMNPGLFANRLGLEYAFNAQEPGLAFYGQAQGYADWNPDFDFGLGVELELGVHIQQTAWQHLVGMGFEQRRSNHELTYNTEQLLFLLGTGLQGQHAQGRFTQRVGYHQRRLDWQGPSPARQGLVGWHLEIEHSPVKPYVFNWFFDWQLGLGSPQQLGFSEWQTGVRLDISTWLLAR